MKLVIALTALNLALLVFTASAQSAAPALRASAIELVDARGVVRSRLNVEPEAAQPGVHRIARKGASNVNVVK